MLFEYECMSLNLSNLSNASDNYRLICVTVAWLDAQHLTSTMESIFRIFKRSSAYLFCSPNYACLSNLHFIICNRLLPWREERTCLPRRTGSWLYPSGRTGGRKEELVFTDLKCTSNHRVTRLVTNIIMHIKKDLLSFYPSFFSV